MQRRAVYINIRDRKDRRDHFEKQMGLSRTLRDWQPLPFEALTPKETRRPSWFPASEGFWASRASHLLSLELALLSNVDELLVMEDDLLLPYPRVFDETFEHVREVLPEKWMGVQFGGYHRSPPTPVCPGLVRLWRFLECPCFLLSKAGIQRVYDHITWWPAKVYDWALSDLYCEEPHFFAPDILPATQLHSHSDNEGRVNH